MKDTADGKTAVHSETPNDSGAGDADHHNARRRGWGILLVLAIVIGTSYALLRQSASFAVGEKPPVSAEKPGEDDSDSGPSDNAKPGKPTNPFPNRFKAPSLDGGVDWLNTSGEITLKDLRGKIVLLDFWTYCCINCMHVLPDLKYLEEKYPKQLVVIGVHSAKFDNEKDSDNIRKAILRYEIEHPVINDAKMTVWRKFGARAWPTLVMVDPEGYYCGYVSGEGNRELLELVVKKLIKYHRKKGTLDESPVRFDLERHKQKPAPLKFPGKVLADEEGNRLFIADTNHNRIVVTTLDGRLLEVIGSGTIGRQDGAYTEAGFDHPQGMTLLGETLYVADTENHLIRKVDLKQKTVSTLAGTGEQARRRYSTGKLREIPLSSPWALKHVNGTLYICMAGPHQIWSHKLGSDTIEVFSGNGREDVTNGTHLSASFAQPSGIASDGAHLYIADSEGSAIRKVDTDPNGKVATVAGPSDMAMGRALFEFGDRDGVGDAARLQHPLGIAYHNKTLYVADSYNHKIKRIEFTDKGGKVSTWLGDGKSGNEQKPTRFFEPGGLSVADGKLYIADTNNHKIRIADLKTGKVREFTIKGLKPPKQNASDGVVATAPAHDVTELEGYTVRTATMLTLKFPVKLPAGYKLNPQFPHRYRLNADGEQTLIEKDRLHGRARLNDDGTQLTVKLPVGQEAGNATFALTLTFGYCRGGKSGLCKLKTRRWKFPLQTAADAEAKVIVLPAAAGDSTPSGGTSSGDSSLNSSDSDEPNSDNRNFSRTGDEQ